MKTHSIIPIFLPEYGCPKQCVFCNQKHISGTIKIPDADEINEIIETHLATLLNTNRKIELAFFGGSFTALDIDIQEKYLKIAEPYLLSNNISNIRISTRPDKINDENLLLLKKYGVKIIELGVQSLDKEVLKLSGRGYEPEIVYEAAEKILNHNFHLGMQMMIGLPGDTKEKSIFTAKEIIRCGAKSSRIYPLLVIKDTPLAQQYIENKYKPLSIEEAIELSANILELFIKENIEVYKIGLHPSDFLYNGTFLAGPWLPNFRQHVQARVWQRKFEKEIANNENIKGFFVNKSDLNSAIGPNKKNIIYFKNKNIPIKISESPDIKKGEYNAIYY